MNYQQRLKEALQEEHAKVFDKTSGHINLKFQKKINNCMICGVSKTKIFCIKDGFKHLKCLNCGFVYVDPRLNEEATFAFYNSKVNEIYNESKFHDNNDPVKIDDKLNLINYNLLKTYISNIAGKKVLEIGPGRGAFLKEAKKDGFDIYAVELNKVLIDQLRPICSEVYEKDLLELDLESNFFDVIYTRDVMEHIPDPVPFLKKINQILKPGGLLLIDTHNIDSLINITTKQYHTVVFAFEHPVHWSPQTLKIACEKVGMKHIKTHFLEMDFSLGNLVNYFTNPSFTYIYPPKMNKIQKRILNFIDNILKIPYVRVLDVKISKFIALKTGRGSKMQVFFTKN
jgi:2-polyprenyl-3-methyl-5-hydroxy-6-metoxy-1,4-benzoquinol methylase